MGTFGVVKGFMHIAWEHLVLWRASRILHRNIWCCEGLHAYCMGTFGTV